MFAYLVGRVAGVTEDNLVLEVGQIGFNIKIPSSLPSLLPPIGEEVKIIPIPACGRMPFCCTVFSARMIWICSGC